MKLLEVRNEGNLLFEVFRFDEHTVVAVLPFELCGKNLQLAMKKLAYGVEVYAECSSETVVYATRLEESGLTDKGKQLLEQLGYKGNIEHNYILLLPLAILLTLILICAIPGIAELIEFCKDLEDIWETLEPIIIYGTIAVIIVGVAAFTY